MVPVTQFRILVSCLEKLIIVITRWKLFNEKCTDCHSPWLFFTVYCIKINSQKYCPINVRIRMCLDHCGISTFWFWFCCWISILSWPIWCFEFTGSDWISGVRISLLWKLYSSSLTARGDNMVYLKLYYSIRYFKFHIIEHTCTTFGDIEGNDT